VEIAQVVELTAAGDVAEQKGEGLEGPEVFVELLITLRSSSQLSQMQDFHKRCLTSG
jgi:hypothetical protein